MTIQEQNRIDNFKAQYNSILSNISIANKELEESLKNAKEAEQHLSKIRGNIIVEDEKLSTIKTEAITINTELAQRERGLDEREGSLNKKSTELNERESSINKEEEKVKEETRQEISKRNIRLIELDKLIKSKASDIGDLINDYGILVQKIQDTKKGLILGTEIGNERLRNLEESIDGKQKELSAIEAHIVVALDKKKEEEDKYKIPRELVAKREKEVAQKEKDVAVLIRRIKKWYKDNRPDVPVKI